MDYVPVPTEKHPQIMGITLDPMLESTYTPRMQSKNVLKY